MQKLTSPLLARPRSSPIQPGTRNDIEAQLTLLESRLDALRAQVRQAQQLSAIGTAALTYMHEASNLLTPVGNYAKAALQSEDPTLMRKALSVAASNSAVLAAMSERLLAVGAAHNGRSQVTLVADAVRAALASLCRDPAKDGIAFKDQTADITVWMDPLHLQQVLFNLFLNAREALAGTHNGRIEVRARRADAADQVLVEVCDNGPGIPSELLPHLFEPLQTSKTSDTSGHPRCHGLGLALCRDLIESVGGTLQVQSCPGQGTTMILLLPAMAPPSSTEK